MARTLLRLSLNLESKRVGILWGFLGIENVHPYSTKHLGIKIQKLKIYLTDGHNFTVRSSGSALKKHVQLDLYTRQMTSTKDSI